VNLHTGAVIPESLPMACYAHLSVSLLKWLMTLTVNSWLGKVKIWCKYEIYALI
jgi:hypothetical protein